MKSTLYLVDDDHEFSRLLLHLLASNPLIHVVGAAGSMKEAIAHIDLHENDVYLVDISLPDGSGIDLMRQIRVRYPNAKILALSTLGDEKHIRNSVQAGASGYLLKSEMPANIMQSIIALINGGGYLSNHASKILISIVNQQGNDSQKHPDGRLNILGKTPNNITHKENEVLHHIKQGLPAKLVADRMGISIFTVNQHLRSLYQKLNARNKTEAVQRAREQGLI